MFCLAIEAVERKIESHGWLVHLQRQSERTRINFRVCVWTLSLPPELSLSHFFIRNIRLNHLIPVSFPARSLIRILRLISMQLRYRRCLLPGFALGNPSICSSLFHYFLLTRELLRSILNPMTHKHLRFMSRKLPKHLRSAQHRLNFQTGNTHHIMRAPVPPLHAPPSVAGTPRLVERHVE